MVEISVIVLLQHFNEYKKIQLEVKYWIILITLLSLQKLSFFMWVVSAYAYSNFHKTEQNRGQQK